MKKYVVKKPRRSRAQDMSDKKQSRLRRARRARAKIRELGGKRMIFMRIPRHMYVQIIVEVGARVTASAPTLAKELRSGNTGNGEAAKLVGTLMAESGKA